MATVFLVDDDDSVRKALARALREEGFEVLAYDGADAFLADAASQQLWRPRVASWLVSGFGVLALLLAATGVYGLVAHDASRRTREIGIRLALGAPLRSVIASVLGRGLGLVAGGLAIGVATALLAASRLRQVLFDLPPARSVQVVEHLRGFQ